MTYENILYEEHGAVALISFNRPASRNAWTVATARETIAAIRRANASADIGAIVLTGEGTVYSAGADIKAPPEPRDEKGRRPTPGSLMMGRDELNWLKLLLESKPTIAAVNGPAVGLGATHILSADIRIAADTASFSFPFLRLGAMPECGATALLGRLIGYGRAADISLRAATVSAEEALRIGLVTALYSSETLREEAIAIAARIASFPAQQVKLTKQMLWENSGEFDANEIMLRESKTFVTLLRSLGRDKPLQTPSS